MQMKKGTIIASILCLSAMIPIIVNAVTTCDPTPVNPDDDCYNHIEYSECHNDGTMTWTLYPGTQLYIVYKRVYNKDLEKYECIHDGEKYLYCGSGMPPHETTGRVICDERAGQTYYY